MTNVSYYIYYM